MYYNINPAGLKRSSCSIEHRLRNLPREEGIYEKSSIRKYRPQKISDVIGQDFAVKTIKNAFELDKLAVFLLTGIGVGKTTIARIIAMGLNCFF